MKNKEEISPSTQWLDLEEDWNDAPLLLRGYFDGASRGNPGEAGAGALLLDGGGSPLWTCAVPLGKKTNNEAEYMALLLLLEEADRRKMAAAIAGDSQLVVNQVTGRWKIKEPRLKELADRAIALLKKTGSTLKWIPREENAAADRLSNEALDGGKGGGEKKGEVDHPPFDPEDLIPVTETIYLARGREVYAVDTLHGACTCPGFQRWRRCRHLDAAQKRREK